MSRFTIQITVQKRRRLRRCRSSKERRSGQYFDDLSSVDEQHLVGKTAGLTQVMGRHHDPCAFRTGGMQDRLDFLRGVTVQIGARFVQKQHLRGCDQGARQGKFLFFPA